MFFIGIDYKLTKKASKFYRLILLAYKPAIADEVQIVAMIPTNWIGRNYGK